MRTVGIIPARYASSRYPGKPVVVIKGVPMILRVAKKVATALGKENTYVATESEIIYNLVKDAGYQVIMTSDEHLTGTDRLAEAAEKIPADFYLNIQGDEPVVNPDDIRTVAELKAKFPAAIINGMAKLNETEDPWDVNIPKVLVNSSGKLLYMSRLPLPGVKNPDADHPPVYYKQICIYGFTLDQLRLFNTVKVKPEFEFQEDIEILRFFDFDVPVQMVEFFSKTMAVDRPEDVQIVERFLETYGDDYYI
ncbi:3-deoxy-manno-octulosonate cytidylyltransferase [Flavihumibacter sp. UBA7668]|uniref:3-deoxy-manno-octulosonate cytidylyltransferase n=1 Tax=Flavihumibacter sp. UBA7668 TaxID=1946542 RepID=UPI0025BC2040|nr:3-deoxy-manno-octulosonate cytidylyltransferase [Flavihumibacter sp. UBA7668]